MRLLSNNAPSGWQVNLLDKVAIRRSGHTPSKSNDTYWNGGIKWVSLADSRRLDQGEINHTDKEISELGIKNSSAVMLPQGTVIISRDAGVGKSAILSQEMAVSQHFITWQCDNEKGLHNWFLYYWLQLNKREFERMAVGSTIKTIGLPFFKKIKIAHPEYSEQKKIAQILSTWDKAIETVEKLIANSQQKKKALMQQLLTGKKRFPEFDGEWKEVQIKGCADSLDNKRIPLNSEQRSVMKGSIPYWGANGIVDYVNDYIIDEAVVLLAEDGGYFNEFSSREIANISYGKAWVNNHAHILKAKENSTNEWLYYSLVHKNILDFINGGTRAKLNKSDMLLIPILLPSIKEQQKIATVLSSADQEIETWQQELEHLKQEKKALMQQLLTGKRRVKLTP